MLPNINELKQLSELNVSRETIELLTRYVDLLLGWNKKINLISASTEAMIWERHIIDSLQLLQHIPQEAQIITDFGSGAGLPALPLALTGRFSTIHAVESDQKKAAFLTECSLLCTNTRLTVHSNRLESLAPWASDVITARALAPLPKLLSLTYPFIQKNTLALFPKGGKMKEELGEAEKQWEFDATIHPSITDNNASILALTDITPRK